MLERIITSSTTRVCAPGTWLEWTYGLVRFYRTEVSVERCIMWRLGRTTGSPEPIMLQIEEDYCLNKSINFISQKPGFILIFATLERTAALPGLKARCNHSAANAVALDGTAWTCRY